MTLDEIEQELKDTMDVAREALDAVEAAQDRDEGEDHHPLAIEMHQAADRLNGPASLASLADALHSEAREIEQGGV